MAVQRPGKARVASHGVATHSGTTIFEVGTARIWEPPPTPADELRVCGVQHVAVSCFAVRDR